MRDDREILSHFGLLALGAVFAAFNVDHLIVYLGYTVGSTLWLLFGRPIPDTYQLLMMAHVQAVVWAVLGFLQLTVGAVVFASMTLVIALVPLLERDWAAVPMVLGAGAMLAVDVRLV